MLDHLISLFAALQFPPHSQQLQLITADGQGMALQDQGPDGDNCFIGF